MSTERLIQLESSLRSDLTNGAIALDESRIDSPLLNSFLATVPNNQLLIEGAVIVISAQKSTLQLGGRCSLKLPIKGVAGEGLSTTTVEIIFTDRAFDQPLDAELQIAGTVSIGGQIVPLTGPLIENALMQLRLGAQPTPMALSEVATFAGSPSIMEYFPAGISVFDSVSLREVGLTFGLAPQAPTELGCSAETTLDWEIIKGAVTLKNVGVTTRTSYYPDEDGMLGSSFGGSIYGTVNIGADFDVTLDLGVRDFWELQIEPDDGGALPSLAAIAALAGGSEMADSVQEGLSSLGIEDLSISAINIGFDQQKKKLKFIAISAHITLDDIGVDVNLSLPNFQFAGNLSSGSTLSLKQLVQKYFPAAEEFPEINITDLAVSAYPGGKTYSIYAEITEDWSLGLGSAAMVLKQVSMALEKSPDGVSGTVSAMAEFAGMRFSVSAEYDPADGLVFKGAIPSINLSALADNLLDGVTPPEELPDVEFSNVNILVAAKTREFRFSGQSTAQWDLPFIGSGLAVSTVDIDLQRGPSTTSATRPLSCSLKLTGGGPAAVADGLTFNSFNISFDLINQTSWSLSGSLAARIFDVDYTLGASADYALATATQRAGLRRLSLSARITSDTPLISLPGVGSLDVDNFAINISKSQPGTPVVSSAGVVSSGSAIPSPDSTPSTGSANPSASAASPSTPDAPPGSSVSPSQPLSYTWDVSATGAVKINGVFTLDGSLQLYKKNGTTGFAFKARDAHVEIPLPVPGHSIKTFLGLSYISLSRATVGAAQSTWAFDGAIDVWFTGLPQTFQKILADKMTGRFKADSNEAVVSINRITDPIEFTVPELQVGSASQPIGKILFDAANFSLRLGRDLKLTMDFGLGLPESLNTIFGTKADGSPQMQFFNSYEPGKPETMTRFRLGVDSLAGVTVQTITSPVKAIRLVQEGVNFWLYANLGEFGEAKCMAPVLSYDGANFTARGAFRQVRPLKLPLTPLKLLLEACKLGNAAGALPEGLPLEELSFVDDNNNFRFDEFFSTLERMGGFSLPSEIKDALQLIESRFDALPERFKSYLKIEIPDAFMFDISVATNGGARGRVWVEGDKPIKVIYPTIGPLGPRLTGIELYSLMFGQVLGGSLLIMNIDARVDQFDLVTLASTLALPLDKLPLLPDTRSFSQHFIIKDLFMIVIYQGAIPIPIPLFFEEFGIEYLGVEGVAFQTHWGFPKPRLNMGEAAKMFSEFKRFFTDRDYLLDAGSAPKELTLQLIVGSNYVGLPKYLGSGTLGSRTALAPVNAFENLAHLLNALKTLSLNEIIQALPFDYREGAERVTFGPLELQAAWLMTTPDEFRRGAYQRLSLQTGDRDALLKILPAAANADGASDADQGLVVFLKGGAKIKNIIRLDCAFGLAASSAMGFNTGFKMKGSVANFVDMELGGIVVINPSGSAPTSVPGAKSPAHDQQPKDAVFRLQGNSQFAILGRRIFEGDIQIEDNSFRFKGKLKLFPEGSPLQVGCDVEGYLDQSQLLLSGELGATMAGLPLRSAKALISNERVFISGAWLGQTVTLDVRNMFNVLVLRGTVFMGFKVQAELGKITDRAVRLADNYRLDVDVTATLEVIMSAARLSLSVHANFLIKGKGESLNFEMTAAPADVQTIAEEVRKRIVAEPRKYFDKMFGDAKDWLKGQATGAFQWTGDQYEEVGKVLKDAYKLSEDQAAAALKEASRDNEHIGRVLAQGYQLSFRDTVGALKSAGSKASDVTGALQKVFPPVPTKIGSLGGIVFSDKGERVVAQALKDVGYNANDVAPALQKDFGTRSQQAMWILRTAGYRAEDAASALKNVFQTPAEDVGKYLKGIYDKSDDAVDKILTSAGYSSKDVFNAMKSVKKFVDKLNPFD